MNGFLNINKPEGISSFDVIRKLRPVMPRVKMGHLGTLDPLASGVLPIAVGWATRLISFIDDQSKSYRADMILGGVSDTQDRTGAITAISHDPVDKPAIITALKSFVGEIDQVPPSYSAVHHQGRRLYELARQGVMVEAEPRRTLIYSINIVDVDDERNVHRVTFDIECSSGTYIRTLCHDAGRLLGAGGYMDSLVRTRVGAFKLEEACELESLRNNRDYLAKDLLSVDYPLKDSVKIRLSGLDAAAVKNGMRVLTSEELENDKLCLLYDEDGGLLALGRYVIEEGQSVLKPVRVVPGNQ